MPRKIASTAIVFSGQNSSTTPRISPTAPLMPSAVRTALMAERVM